MMQVSGEMVPIWCYKNTEINLCKAITHAATKKNPEAKMLKNKISAIGRDRLVQLLEEEEYADIVENLHPEENPWDTDLTTPEKILGINLSRALHKELFDSMIDAEYTFTRYESEYAQYFYEKYFKLLYGCGDIREIMSLHRKISREVYAKHVRKLRAGRKIWRQHTKEMIKNDD